MNEKRKSLIPGGNIYRKYLAVLVFLVAAAVMVNMGVMAFVRSELVAQLRESQDTYVAAHSSFMDEAFAAVENVITDISFSSAVERRSTPIIASARIIWPMRRICNRCLRPFPLRPMRLMKSLSGVRIRPIYIRSLERLKRRIITITVSMKDMLIFMKPLRRIILA